MVFSKEAYTERINALFTRFQSVQRSGFNKDSFKSGLDGIRLLDGICHSPWKNYGCVHVAGTNGKGSVCSMIASALAATGLKVGLYTSPHLLDFRERCRIVTDRGWEMIGQEEVWDFLETYERSFDSLSFFEITTGLAFKWFSDRGVDMAVIETGLGGLLDSTNIIVPEVSVITGIGLDHCALLGDSVGKIAYQKAGIFKPGVPAVVWAREDETCEVFEQVAAKTGASLHFADAPVPERILPDLKGPYQKTNVRTALSALTILLGDKASSPAVIRAIENTGKRTGLRGRWETLCKNPDVLCDIGHNPQALAVNFAALEAMPRNLVIVYGIMADKDLDAIAPLMPSRAKYVLTQAGTPRALPVEELRSRLERLRPDLDITVEDGVAKACGTAIGMSFLNNNALIYIGGSTFVVSEAIEYFEE